MRYGNDYTYDFIAEFRKNLTQFASATYRNETEYPDELFQIERKENSLKLYKHFHIHKIGSFVSITYYRSTLG